MYYYCPNLTDEKNSGEGKYILPQIIQCIVNVWIEAVMLKKPNLEAFFLFFSFSGMGEYFVGEKQSNSSF